MRGFDANRRGFSTLVFGDPDTLRFVDDALGEVAALTTGPYLHIGGDEAKATKPADYRMFRSAPDAEHYVLSREVSLTVRSKGRSTLRHTLHCRTKHDRKRQAVVVIDAVIEEVVRILAIPVGENFRTGTAVIRARSAHDSSTCGVTHSVHARAEGRQLNKVPAIQRQLIHQSLVHNSAKR